MVDALCPPKVAFSPGFDKEVSPVPRLTILIPCLGGAAQFDSTLVSVLQNRPPQAEVLVVHTEEYDDPYDLRGEVCFLHCPSEATIAGLINAGTGAATGHIIHVLTCGLEVEEGWTAAAIAHFSDEDVAAVSPAIVGPDRGGSAVPAPSKFWLPRWQPAFIGVRHLWQSAEWRRHLAMSWPMLGWAW
jgi:hypothetical protein